MRQLTKKDFKGNYTFTATKKTEPITVETMELIWKEAKIIPYKFKPTGEVVYFTPEIHFKMEHEKLLKKGLPNE